MGQRRAPVLPVSLALPLLIAKCQVGPGALTDWAVLVSLLLHLAALALLSPSSAGCQALSVFVGSASAQPTKSHGESTGLWHVCSYMAHPAHSKCFGGSRVHPPTDAVMNPLQNTCYSISIVTFIRVDSVVQLHWSLKLLMCTVNFSLLGLRQLLPALFGSHHE